MANSNVKVNINEIIPHLEFSSDEIIYENLVQFRKIAVDNECLTYFRAHNGLKHLVRFLSLTPKIINVTLSIIGAICLKNQCVCIELVELDIIEPLVDVLHKSDNDSILTRASLAVGNLIQEHDIAVKLHQANVVSALLRVINMDRVTVNSGQLNAIRALRLLWCTEQHRNDMLKLGAVRAVMKLLSPHQLDTMEITSVNSLMKALLAFTTNCSDLCATEVQMTDGLGFRYLVALLSRSNTKDQAWQCIVNLCHVACSRPGLGSAGVVEEIIHFLEQKSHVDSLTQINKISINKSSQGVVYALCLLCRESVNRAKIRTGGGLPLLLSVLRSSSTTGPLCVLEALVHFFYDDLSLNLMLREGLVTVLISKLNRYVTLYSEVHKKVSSKRKCVDTDTCLHQQPSKLSSVQSSIQRMEMGPDNSHEFAEKCRDWTKRMSEDSLHYQTINRDTRTSPTSSSWQSGSDSGCGSPSYPLSPTASSLSPASSPASSSGQFDYPQLYSPVCFEDDDCEDLQMESEESDTDPVEIEDNHKEDGPLLVLLSRVSHMETPVPELVGTSSMDTLLLYITRAPKPALRANRILLRVSRNENYLVPHILQQLPLSILSRLCEETHFKCLRCETQRSLGQAIITHLGVLAGSEFAMGELLHFMIKGDSATKALLAVTIPILIKSPRKLYLLMLEHGGLDLLLTILERSPYETDLLSRYSADSLSRLAVTLRVPNPKTHRSNLVMKPNENQGGKQIKGRKVEMELDDGVVETDCSLLSQHSPFFQAMFRGDFIEATLPRVSLPGISSDCFTRLLLMFSGSSLESVMGDTLDSALELLQAVERFMVPDCSHLPELIASHFLTPTTALALYSRTQDCTLPHSETLANYALSGLLTFSMGPTRRKQLLDEVLNGTLGLRVLDDFRTILTSKLIEKRAQDY